MARSIPRFDVSVDGTVRALAVSGTERFTWAATSEPPAVQTRQRLAAIDLSAGSVKSAIRTLGGGRLGV